MSLYDDMPDVDIDNNAHKKRKIEAISQGNNTNTTKTTTTTTTPAAATTTTSTNTSNDKKNDINIPETITKLSNYMNKDDKFVKASSLFVNVINSYINDDNTIELILRSITFLITFKRDYDNTIYWLSYVNIFRSLYDNIDLCKAFILSKSQSSSSSSLSTEGEGVMTSLQILSMNELTNWISKTVLVHDLDTDDSYIYTQCCKDITLYIKSLDNTTTNTDTNTTDDIEKQVIILKLLSTSYKSYHLAWKCPLIKAMFKEASARRLKFDASLRNELDDLNTNMMKDERKTSSNTKNRTVRVTNSIAHPLRNIGGENSILR